METPGQKKESSLTGRKKVSLVFWWPQRDNSNSNGFWEKVGSKTRIA